MTWAAGVFLTHRNCISGRFELVGAPLAGVFCPCPLRPFPFYQMCMYLVMLCTNSNTAVLRTVEKRFTADAAIMDIRVPLQRKEKGEKKRGKARADKAG